MTRSRQGPGPLLDRGAPRELFSELVAGAMAATRPPPTELARAYLVELLTGRVRQGPSRPRVRGGEPALAEELLRARLESGTRRRHRLHALGDRALFVSGFFGDSLRRSLVGLDYYREIGRTAYADLAAELGAHSGGPTWTGLFQELADRFRDFVDVLAEVGDRACRAGGPDLLRAYERYLETGSARDRRRLLALGQALPDRRRHRTWQ